jgi:UDP-N-acetylmuramoyl-tripeptide--D-alanyl-D-alanine ligase
MIELTLEEIARVTGGQASDATGLRIAEVATDTRRLVPGAMFVALRGESADGHDHLAAAVEAGAVAALVERVPEGLGLPTVRVDDTWRALADLGRHVRERVAPHTVAVTGSVGKTTTKDLIGAATAAGRRVVAARGSFNNELGVPLTLLRLEPDSEVLVAELGARHVGDIATLAPLVAPDVAVVTAVAGVHLEVFGSIEAIGRAKQELVEALGPDGLAVLNADYPRVAAMAEAAPAVLTYAVDAPDADVRAEDIELDASARARFTAVTPWGRVRVSLPVAGRHHVGNALAALAVAGHLGVDLEAAAAAIAGAAISPWRGEVVQAGDARVLNDAYNANPTSMAAALDTLVALRGQGRTWAVLGVMAEIGGTAEDEHRALGARCAETGVDRLVAVGEHADVMAAGAREAGLADEAIAVVDDAEAATALLRAQLGAGDVVLVKASRVAGLEQVADALVASADDRDAVEGAR